MWKTFILLFILLMNLEHSKVFADDFLSAIFKFFSTGENRLKREIQDQSKLLSVYDFIIVGAGTAGCAMANRLSENPKWNVLLIEAGNNENLLMDVPLFVHYLQDYNINWHYRTEKSDKYCLGMKNNQCNWPRGKVMGGSSVLNYMVYTRGHPRDYDRWADLGNIGWNYDNITKYFKKLENYQIPDAAPGYHGYGGPVTVSYPRWRSDVVRSFIQSGLEKGFPYVDYNGPSQIGFSYLQASINNGTRVSSNNAYLYPIAGRRNLHVKKNTIVTNLLFDANNKNRVVGVRIYNNGKYSDIRASKEVILSAGALNTPQILMLSGIGPKKHLQKHGIKCIKNLAVGYNLMDHTAPGALTFLVNVSTIQTHKILQLGNLMNYGNNFNGPLSSPGGVEGIAFVDTDSLGGNLTDGYPDIELLQVAASINADPIFRKNFGIKDEIYDKMFMPLELWRKDSFMVFPLVMRPKSRGRIMLRNNSPFASPVIIPNYFEDPYDVDRSIRGIKLMISLMDTKAFKKINGKLLTTPVPGCEHLKFNTDPYWECYTRHFTFTIYHHCGTAKMGPKSDRRAVVDARLRVYGIDGLRVVDASIMPEIVTGHTNGPIFMIAEKAADMIKQDWNFPTT